MYVPLTALNASADPTAIVYSNHVPMNRMYAVSTEAVCSRRKSTVCSSFCTNINNMIMSTSAKLPSKAMKTIKHPRKVLKMAHVNICSLRNKVFQINNLLVTNYIHIMTISNSLGQYLWWYSGSNTWLYHLQKIQKGVSVYIQNHIPIKLREDITLNTAEVLWLQVNLPHIRPILVGSCYRPPSANSQYLDKMCKMLHNVFDINRGIFSGWFDWLSSSSPLKKKLKTLTSAWNLVQVISQPTRVVKNSTGMKSSTFIDLIFTNAADICFKTVSKSIGCSHHNMWLLYCDEYIRWIWRLF